MFQSTDGIEVSSPEEIIAEARNGRMFILVDDAERENEGDLVIPAQMATPDAINFMAKYGRGLICLALAKERIDALGLPLMAEKNGTFHETAFTVSIEARDGVTTGISAADRARTISVAIDASKGRDHLVSPGHVFPLVARPGGVLVRAGHTEAAVDVARLAGLNPSGVICEIMRDDGQMARMPDLKHFASLHGLRIGTIRDLIAFRRRHDHLIERRTVVDFDSYLGGQWQAISFYNKASATEQLALVKGGLDPSIPTLVRIHTVSFFSDMLCEKSERLGLLQSAMAEIAKEGRGVVVIINRQGPDLISKIMKVRTAVAESPEMEAIRDYGVGAQILADLGVQDMILLTNTHHTLVALSGYGLSIVGERPIPLSALAARAGTASRRQLKIAL